MPITIPLIAADGVTSTVTLPDPVVGSSPGITIPTGWSDPRFTSNVAAGSASGAVHNKDWNANPSYVSGDQCFYASGFSSITQCRIDWREGPRLDQTNGSTFVVDQCYINCVGNGADHADAFQAYAGTGTKVNFVVTNSCIHAYSDSAAAAKYGSGFVGSTCLFWADSAQGSISLSNCLLIGGTRMLTINCDKGPTHVSLNNVYFISDPDTLWQFNAVQDGGTLIIDSWTNVFNATLVNGVIIPGAAIPHP